MADFLLSVGVDVDLSYKQMQKDINGLVISLNENPQKVRIGLEIDQNAINTFRAEIANIHNSLGGLGGATVNPIDTSGMNSAAVDMSNIAASANNAAIATKSANEEFKQSQNNVGILTKFSKEYYAALNQVQSLLTQVTNNQEKWTAARNGKSSGSYSNLTTYSSELNNLIAKIQSGTMKTEEFKNSFSWLKSKIGIANGEIKAAGENTKTWSERVGGLSEKFTTWFSITRVIMAAYRAIRQMVTSVIELDTAMTELKKVTDETDATYETFLENAAVRAKNLGTELADIVSATADFARLGYSISDAEKLADTSIVYKNVGDGIKDINEASESIIATMQAFSIPADEAMKIIDRFNEVGNNYAISSKGVGDALLRSAAAMNAANNSLDETIALATAANTVVQDPEKVGTTLKTVSMYLRAAKTEAEDAGESTEGMAESVSELRGEILALTGNRVDIQIDENTFKSTYQILKELSQVWNELTDISKANILEMVGGKRNSNVVAALLENFSVAENALKTSAESAGSALAENEKYLESINGKTSQLKATFQEFSNTLINSDFIKSVVDMGSSLIEFLNGVVRVVNAVGGLKTVLISLTAILAIQKAEWIANKSAMVGNFIVTKLTSGFNGLKTSLTALPFQIDAARSAWKMYSTGALTASGSTITLSTALQASIPIIGWVLVAVTALAAGISIYKNKIEEANRAAQESAKSYQESTNSIEEYKTKIIELRNEINSGNLSEQEAYNKRQELISIQDSLIEKFGDEAEAINLVTGEIDSQIKKIDELNEKEWKNWRRENYKATERSIEAIIEPSSEYSTAISMNLKDEDYIKAIEDALSTKRIFKDGSGVLIEIPEEYTKDLFSLKEAYELIFDAAEKYVNQLDESDPKYKAHKDQLESLSNIIKEINSELDKHEDVFNTYAEGQLMYSDEYSKTWSKVLAAQKEYDDAVLSGDDEAIQAAVEKMNSAEAEFLSLNVDDEAVALYAKEFFEKFNEESKKYEIKIELSADDNKTKSLVQEAVKSFEDETGKVDLSSILNTGIEYENNPNRETLTEKEQAYAKLKNAADEYGISVEELLGILDELGYIELDVAGKTDELEDSINSLSKAVSTLDSMSDLGKTMNSIIGSINKGDGLQFDDLNTLSEKMTELGLSTDEYLDRIIEAKNSSADMQKVFSDITNELISQKIASGDLTEADEDLLSVWLESIGVANAAKVAHNALAINKDAVAQAEKKLSNATDDNISTIYDEIVAMMSEQGATAATKQALLELALEKMTVNNNKIDTSDDIRQIIALANAALAGEDAITRLNQALKWAESVENGYQGPPTKEVYETLESLNNSSFNFEYQTIDPNDFILTGSSSGGSSSSGKDANLEAWEKLVNEKKHLVEMDKMTQEEYYDWLASAYKSHLSDTEKYSDELRSIEKELYDWEKQKIQSKIDDEVAILDNQKAQGLISEKEYFEKLDELYSEGYDNLQQAVDENGLYGVDNTERLKAETEFIEKVKDAHNSAYEADRKALDHKLAMNLISEEQYLIELQRLYDEYYRGQDMYSDEAMELEEELYDKRVELIEKWADAAAEAIDAMAEATEGMIDAIKDLIQDSIDTNEENFNLEKSLLDHALAMNYISEEQYYSDLEKLYKKYFKDKTLYTEQYWENQEEVYQHEQEMLEDSASAIEDIHAKVVDLIKKELEEAIDAIEETKDKYLDLIEIRREALKDMKDEDDYEKERSEKLSSISELQRQLNALAYDTSAEGVAKYKEVYAQLQEAQKELADFENDRAYDKMNDQLDKEADGIENKYDGQTSDLEAMLDDNEYLVNEAWARLNDKNADLYNQLIEYNKKYSTSIKDDVTGSWETATAALQKYTDAKLAYEDITMNKIGASGMTDDEFNRFQGTTDLKQAYNWAKVALQFGASMLSIGGGLLSSFMGIAGGLMGGLPGSFLTMGSGLVGTFAGLGSSILGVLGSFATGTDYVPKTGWYKTDELGSELKFVKDGQGNQYRVLTEGSKVIDADTTALWIQIMKNPNLFANAIQNKVLSSINSSLPNISSNINDVVVSPVFQIQSSDPNGVAIEIEKLMPKIADYTVGRIVDGMGNIGVKRLTQKLI